MNAIPHVRENEIGRRVVERAACRELRATMALNGHETPACAAAAEPQAIFLRAEPHAARPKGPGGGLLEEAEMISGRQAVEAVLWSALAAIAIWEVSPYLFAVVLVVR